ncbi:MAG: hypothetical protein LGR52_10940 [Candidatus Thiosymbion ectosymbiont of Robbea hypermnestra]|nr:hypothetical protein [Candidatus Thiosymbion ectosymbiont of Robbea hypermnestra]
MIEEQDHTEPDWNNPLPLSLTPAMLIHSLMTTASAVHTGWSSCIDEQLVVSSLMSLDDTVGNYVRLVEQEFYEDEDPDAAWHDWTLELRIANVLISGHWQVAITAPPMEWTWYAKEAERAFERASLLVGRRVRKGLMVDDPTPEQLPPRASRH